MKGEKKKTNDKLRYLSLRFITKFRDNIIYMWFDDYNNVVL